MTPQQMKKCLSMKEGSLFVHDLPNHTPLCSCLGSVEKPSMSTGVSSWFHNVFTHDEKVIEY